MRSGGMGWCQWRATLFFFSFLLQMCSATVLDCTSTGNNPMLFSTSDQHVPPGTECDYWWNRGEITLATSINNNKSALVMRHTSSSLETSECLPDVSWTQQCSQSQNLMDFSANCSTTCASKNSLHGDRPTTGPSDEEGLSNTSIGAIAGITLLIIGLIGLIIFLFYKYKDSIPRTLNCSLIGRVYRAGQRKNNEPGDIIV